METWKDIVLDALGEAVEAEAEGDTERVHHTLSVAQTQLLVQVASFLEEINNKIPTPRSHHDAGPL